MGLRKKITLLFSILFAILIGMVCLFLADSVLSQFKRDFSERIRFSSEHIKNGLVALMLEGKGRDFQSYLESELIGDVKSIRLLRDDGLIIGSSNPAEVNTFYPEDKIRAINGDNSKFFKLLTDITDIENLPPLYIPLYNEMPCQRCHTDDKKIRAILEIEISSGDYSESVSRIKRNTLLYFIISIALSTGIIWLFAGSFFEKPLRDFLKTLESVKRGDLKARVSLERFDEIGDMARGINDLISDLERIKKDFELCHLDEMRRMEQMATLGELASAIAHEIRNPLAGISGAVQVLSEEFPASDPRQPIIKEIINEVERLDRSIKDLLIFAKTPELSLKHISAKFTLEKLSRFIEPQAKKSNVNITLIIPEDHELYVDPDQIHQAFFNIAQFSLQNMPEGGTLKIEFGALEKFYIVSFSDTGHGIPSDEVKLLFKPFYTGLSGSSSIGLSISKGIIEKHGGKIEVESMAGKGTTFKVYLPYGVRIG